MAVHDYQEAVSAVEKNVETKFAAAVRDIVNNAVDEIKESVMLGGNMEKNLISIWIREIKLWISVIN